MCSVLLSYGFGIKGYDVTSVIPLEGAIVIQIEQPREKLGWTGPVAMEQQPIHSFLIHYQRLECRPHFL